MLDAVRAAFQWVVDAASAAFGWIRDHWPLLLSILGGPIGAAVAVIATHWDSIKSGASAVVDFVKAAWNSFIGFFKGLPGQITSVAGNMWSGLTSGLQDAVNFIIRMINKVIGGINALIRGYNKIPAAPNISQIPTISELTSPSRGSSSGTGGKVGHVLAMAEGGIVKPATGGTLARIGEAGHSEAVIPLNRAGIAVKMTREDLDYLANRIAREHAAIASPVTGAYAGASAAKGIKTSVPTAVARARGTLKPSTNQRTRVRYV